MLVLGLLFPVLVLGNPEGVLVYSFEKLRSFPHSQEDFTQGLIMESPEVIVQSTGLYGKSKLQRLNLSDYSAILEVELDNSYFGEGITNLNGKLYQLTWREGKMLVYDQSSFELLETVSLPRNIREGWGICTDGTYLYITEGSHFIFVMSPQNYSILRIIPVKHNNKNISRLNELEWIDGEIWANLFYSHYIARINPNTGEVNSWVNFEGLEAQNEYRSWARGDVLNGIASLEDTLLVTGKRWANIYQVQLTGPEVWSEAPN